MSELRVQSGPFLEVSFHSLILDVCYLRLGCARISVMRVLHLSKLVSWRLVWQRPVSTFACAQAARSSTAACYSHCTPQQQQQMSAYLDLVLEANQNMNLTGEDELQLF